MLAAGISQLSPGLPVAAATAAPTPRPLATPLTTVRSAQPAIIKDEHVQPAPPRTGTRSGARIMPQMNLRRSEVSAPVGSRMQAAQPMQATTASTLQFLTRPYLSWHDITSAFDHCNPDYTHDGRVCEFDGSVGLNSNGVDPSFSLGYAQTRGGSDYLYYDGHNGWDYSMAYENVFSAAPGTVTLAGTDSVNTCFGQNVIIDHGNGFSTRYAHLSGIYVSVGQVLDRAQVIGQSGNTGCSSGPHLHFGVYSNSSWTAVDPWGWWGAAGADPWAGDQGSLWLTGSAQFPLPSAPTNVTALAGNASATVSWTPSSFDGGRTMVYYVVTASPGGQRATVAGNLSTALVTGLSNGTPYTFTVTALNGVGATTSAASIPVTPSAWIGQLRPLTPARLLDTRTSIGGVGRALAAGETHDLTVVGSGGVPPTAVAAVVLNVTVTGASGPGYLTVFPSGSPQPQSSAINFRAGDTIANLIQAPVGAGGNVSIFVGGAAAQVVVDVNGYYSSDLSSGAGLLRPLLPARIADSRSGTGLATALAAGQSENLQVTGQGGVPASGVTAVVLNLTATNATAAGWLSVGPSGSASISTSNLNFKAGQTVANRVISAVGPDGKVTIHNAAGLVQVVVDVNGWFTDASAAVSSNGRYVGLAPTRVVDTRTALGGISTLNAGQTAVGIGGQAGIPTGGAVAAILNVTVTDAGAIVDFLSLYPSDSAYRGTTDINFRAGETRANHVVSRLGADGKLNLYAAVGPFDAIVDVEGYYSS